MRPLILVFMFALSASPVFAQDATPAAENPVHEELRTVRAAALEAIATSNLEGLLAVCHPEVAFTTTNGEIARGHAPIKAYFNRMMTGPDKIVQSVKFGLETESLSVLHGEDTAIGYGSSTDTYTLTNGEEFVLKTRWSATLVKHEGKWVIASFHSSVNVFDNAILSGAKKMLPMVGGAAFVIALILGLLIGRRLGSKPAAPQA